MSVGNETEHYNSVLEITVSFLGTHKMGTRHLYWILPGPSFTVRRPMLGLTTIQSDERATENDRETREVK
jgi:hypothetical protein